MVTAKKNIIYKKHSFFDILRKKKYIQRTSYFEVIIYMSQQRFYNIPVDTAFRRLMAWGAFPYNIKKEHNGTITAEILYSIIFIKRADSTTRI